MFPNLIIAVLGFLLLPSMGSCQQDTGFIFNGFRSDNAILALDFMARYTPRGLLCLTPDAIRQVGRAFYPEPITFKNSTNGTVFSFSTKFVFAVIPEYQKLGGHGITFVVAPERGVPRSLPSQYLGIFNENNMGSITNHLFAVELDTILTTEFKDINDNHVGIDINSLVSAESSPAGYYSGNGFNNLNLISGQPMQVWVEYDGTEKHINVTLAPFNYVKPTTPLLSLPFDLSPIFKETMYVGFSASTGWVLSSQYVLGWSFKVNGRAQELTLSELPKLPATKTERSMALLFKIGVPVISVCFSSMAVCGVFFFLRKWKYAEVLEDWERDYGPHRFKYRELYAATKGFREKELLGTGGFGRVYRGVLPTSKIEIAVKRVSHESKQGIKEFVAEIITIGRLRHRNLVALLGYCRRKNELLLVYEYMPNGSLNKYLYNQPKVTLTWSQRFRVIKGVASGLLYLHEGWEKVVIHRDIKASNVLLDLDMNPRLGDFGLARLYNHEAEPQTTHVAGTFGYLAPEHVRTSKATKATDVFAFGAFLLEVACGRKPIENRRTEDMVLVDWVFSRWSRGEILEVRDPNLGAEFVPEEVEVVLMLGLMCSHSDPAARPSIRQVVQYLDGDIPLQQLSSSLCLCANGLTIFSRDCKASDDCPISVSSSGDNCAFPVSSCVIDSVLSGGR